MLEKRALPITAIRVPAKRAKTLDAGRVQALAEDMLENGQTTPIQVRKDGDGFILIEGLHRLHALREIGETNVDAYLVRARLH
jgi:ParB-like chromosome segregation protein Spo0J